MKNRLLKLSNVILAALVTCCIEPINFERPELKSQLAVDGFISNEEGPYTVNLSRSRAVVGNQTLRTPVLSATVYIHSDAGESEKLIEKGSGAYMTTQIQGVIGRSYWITIELLGGAKYESVPEMIKPPGNVELIQYEYEHRTKIINGLESRDDRFNVFVDATSSPESENYFRWKLTGTYKIETRPDLITKDNPNPLGPRLPDPAPCSGWIVQGGSMVQTGLCTCCVCYVTNNDEVPRVSDDEFIEGNEFRHVQVGIVPISPVTFFDKYHVSISQMALTKTTFDFFRLIKVQKEGVTSLFQPVAGKLRGNVVRTDEEEEVLGLFYAAGISNKTLYIDRYTLPVYPGPLDPPIMEDCRKLKNSSTTKPSFWQ